MLAIKWPCTLSPIPCPLGNPPVLPLRAVAAGPTP